MSTLNWNYSSPGPVASAFIRSTAFMCGIRGPIGSGKSTAAIMKLIRNARSQRRGPDGWIRRRTAIIRNTQPELKTTTIKSWHQWIPPDVGSWVGQGPPTQHIVDPTNKFDWEVLFVALDRPADVRKVLSMDLSDCWINEAREIAKPIVDGLTGRVGRYPSVLQGGCDNVQIIMDTNSMDSDHWWYVLAERDESTPSAREIWESTRMAEDELRSQGILAPGQKVMEFFSQPSGESPEAENLQWLRPGYYTFAKIGKSADWIKVYVRNEYGFVRDGKVIYDQYVDAVHCQPFELIKGVPLSIGIDFGLTPAATIGQQTLSGAWRTRYELVTQRMGVKNFAKELKLFIEQHPDLRGTEFRNITGDPAGAAADANEETVFQILKAGGIDAQPAPTNEFSVRRDAVNEAFGRMIDGQPGAIIHPHGCPVLRKACAGGYAFRRIWVGNLERYADKPDKNMFSHVAEAYQYQLLGAGEGRAVVRAHHRARADRPRYAQT